MGRKNKGRHPQNPKPWTPRMPHREELDMGTKAFDSGKRQFEDDEDMPMQCVDCGDWFSDSDLCDGICQVCEELYDEEESREQAFEDSGYEEQQR